MKEEVAQKSKEEVNQRALGRQKHLHRGEVEEGEQRDEQGKILTAAEKKMRLLARIDDYRLDAEDLGKKGNKKKRGVVEEPGKLGHRMNRTKRRRMEALQVEAEERAEQGEEGNNSNNNKEGLR